MLSVPIAHLPVSTDVRLMFKLVAVTMGIATLLLNLLGCGQASRMSGEQFAAFAEECRRDLRTKIEAAVATWHLDKMKGYDLDQTKGTLAFTDESGHKISCTIQIVGTFSKESNTWLWSWASPWVAEPLKRDSELVREFGRTNRLEKLTTEKWPATEADGWVMTAVALRVAGAESAYRLPNRDSYIFMLLKKVESMPNAKQ
jgi:hypothetical protein